MKIFTKISFLILTLLPLLTCFNTAAAEDECKASAGYGFVCGPKNAEDLVLVPGTDDWIIASGMAAGAGLYLINAGDKSWNRIYPSGASRTQQDMKVYGDCPGAPDPDNFQTHGLNIRRGEDGHSTLYAVSHGGREAIEVFDVDAGGGQPVLTWTGCVLMPQDLAANSVASFSDGSLVATVLVMPGKSANDSVAGKSTGAVFQWSPGNDGFELIKGSELPANNGIEVSADGKEIYVVSSGLSTIIAFSYSNPTTPLRTTRRLPITPDNVHMGSDGRLITAGMVNEDATCGSIKDPATFDLEKIAACSRPMMAFTIDPATMLDTVLMRGPVSPAFSNATMVLPVGNEIWIGSFSSDRIAYRSRSNPGN